MVAPQVPHLAATDVADVGHGLVAEVEPGADGAINHARAPAAQPRWSCHKVVVVDRREALDAVAGPDPTGAINRL